MSETTVTTSAPIPQPETAAPATLADRLAAGLAQENQQLAKEAKATLRQAVEAFQSAERAYRTGFLEAGRLMAAFIAQSLRLKRSRKNAVADLLGELSRFSSKSLGRQEVNRLISAWEACRLLNVEPGLPAALAIPYGHYRDCWARLVQRVNKDTPTEEWSLLPGREADSRAAFKAAAESSMSKLEVEKLVKMVLGEGDGQGRGRRRAAAEQPQGTEPTAEGRAPNLLGHALDSAQAGTAKDNAAFLFDYLSACGDVPGALTALVELLAREPARAKVTPRDLHACQAFLLAHRSYKPNGHTNRLAGVA